MSSWHDVCKYNICERYESDKMLELSIFREIIIRHNQKEKFS